MKIAQIAPLEESCPPRLYGGTERIVSYLTEELVRQGHEVTLFASGDSRTKAHLVPCSKEALRLDPNVKNSLPWHVAHTGVIRSPIPIISGRSFRFNPVTDSGVSDHPGFEL